MNPRFDHEKLNVYRASLVLVAKKVLDEAVVLAGKEQLLEIVSMLIGSISSLTAQRGEEEGSYSFSEKDEQEQE